MEQYIILMYLMDVLRGQSYLCWHR